LFRESAPFDEDIKTFCPYFYLLDYDLNKLGLVLPKSYIFFICGFSITVLIDSNEVRVPEFFDGRFIFLLELGLALMSGRNDSVDFISSLDFSTI